MKILFYQEPPPLNTTMLTWTLGQELILKGHEVYFAFKELDLRDQNVVNQYKGKIDWVRAGSTNSVEGVAVARAIGAKVHVHLEGLAYFRIGAESAKNWGYKDELRSDQISWWRDYYRSWMKAAYEADSCSVNGKNQIDAIENDLFEGKKLSNCHRLSCGVDARYALTLRNYAKRNYMITVSRLEPNKKIMMIAKALSLLPQDELPGWVIVGSGTHDQVAELQNFCEKNKIIAQLRPCFGAEKWWWIKRAKIMLQGWSGIPPSEGLVCDTPVLSFAHPDIVEMYSGAIWWAKDNSPESFAHVLKRLLEAGDYVLDETTRAGMEKLLGGKLYACTQEQLAEKYDQIFHGKLKPWNDADGWSVESADPVGDIKRARALFKG